MLGIMILLGICVIIGVIAISVGSETIHVDKSGNQVLSHDEGSMRKRKYDWMDGLLGFVITFLILSVIYVTVVSSSYATYINDRAFYDGIIEQYRGCITMYENKSAVIDIGKASPSLTDLKYQGYQQNMADMIKDLRCKISEYNESILEKRTMKKNPFFSACIIAPDDDMKILGMTK
jgi:hypothetical protein